MIIERIKELLKANKQVDGWKITEHLKEAYELFYVKKELDMNRSKNVHDIELVVFRDFTDELDVKFRGAATTKIHPTMTKNEIKQAIDEAVYAAEFAKNKYYPLAKVEEVEERSIESNLWNYSVDQILTEISGAIFKADVYEKGFINSTEIFLNKNKVRIMNSNGVDVNYQKYTGEVEFITTWKGETEEIELYKYLRFSSLNTKQLTNDVDTMLKNSKARAIASPMKSLNETPVILTGDAVSKVFTSYVQKANVGMIYQKYSSAKIGESIQGSNIQGDQLNIKLDPFMEGSTFSQSFDGDGVPLKSIELIKDGILKRYYGNLIHSYYLGVEPTGEIRNIAVEPGSKSAAELKSEPYLEIESFSNFQLDPFTGNFGGEIRLAYYYDGNEVVPLSGGAISGVLKENQSEMYFSKETIQINNYKGPKYIKMNQVSISGD